MTYSDSLTGKEKHWTQSDLAKQLGLKEIMVNLMENKNQGLDSIERRQALVTILKIPPVLLGLGSIDQIVEIVTGQEIEGPKSTNIKRSKISRESIKVYHDTFKVYDILFAEGTSYESINHIDKWTKRIERDLKNIDSEDKSALMRVLWNFEILCSKIYSSDVLDWTKTFEHMDNAIEIATLLDDTDLQAASLYISGATRLQQGRPALARVDIDSALMYAKGALPQTKGAIYSLAAIYHSQDTSLAEITYTQNLLDNAEKLAGAKSEMKTIKFGNGKYLLDRANTLIRLGRPAKAIEFLDEAEQYINPSRKRLLVFLDILRARCYIEMKKPVYDKAIRLLEEAVTDSANIKVERHVRYIQRLHTTIQKSPYGNAPEVVDLGMQLRELRKLKK